MKRQTLPTLTIQCQCEQKQVAYVGAETFQP